MKKLSVMILFMLFCAGNLFAEYIYLKNGREIKGKIVAETNKTVTVLNEATKKRVVLKFDNIADITKTRKSDIEITRLAKSAKDAATQFTSSNKPKLDGSDTYVQNNKTGVIVYNVKEAVIENDEDSDSVSGISTEADKGNYDAAAYLLELSEPAKPAGKPAAKKSTPKESKKKTVPAAESEDSGFDAAAYLLGNSASPAPKAAKKAKEKPAKKESKKIEQMDEEEYDAAKYLLGASEESASAPKKKERKKKEKQPKEKPAKKESKKMKQAQEDYASPKYLSGASSYAPQSFNEETENAEYSETSSGLSAETVLGIGFDLKGQSKFSGTPELIDADSDFGMSLFLERYGYFCSFAAVGAGIGYEHKRGLENMSGRFGFIPLYAALKARLLPKHNKFNLYAVAHFGYNFMIANDSYLDKADAEGGLYYAFGPGVVYDRVVFQVLYSFNNGGMQYSGIDSEVDIDVNFSKIGFSVGYMF